MLSTALKTRKATEAELFEIDDREDEMWQWARANGLGDKVTYGLWLAWDGDEAAANAPAFVFRPVNGPSMSTVHRLWLDRGLPAHTFAAWAAAGFERHTHNHRVEVRLSDCEHGCKVHRCECDDEQVQHMAVYGCPLDVESRVLA